MMDAIKLILSQQLDKSQTKLFPGTTTLGGQKNVTPKNFSPNNAHITSNQWQYETLSPGAIK
jgi:hypothetical protein